MKFFIIFLLFIVMVDSRDLKDKKNDDRRDDDRRDGDRRDGNRRDEDKKDDDKRDNDKKGPLQGRRHFNPLHDEDWKTFKNKFQRKFDRDDDEDNKRSIWEDRVDHIKRHNDNFQKGQHKYRIGLNEFADFSHEEYMKMNGYQVPNKTEETGVQTKFIPSLVSALAGPDTAATNTTVDWRNKGMVSPIKFQRDCGSCWSFSACGALEAQLKLKTGKLISLSEQNLVDCSKSLGNNGCNGGAMQYAFQYAINNGIDSEDHYPYKGVETGTCSYKKTNSVASCKSFVNLPQGDEEALRKAVATVGPVSVAIDASPESFQLYQDGIYDSQKCSNTSLTHGVLVIGYGTDNGTDYWLLKNSWGVNWGISGYFKLARNNFNQCGIANQAIYPLM